MTTKLSPQKILLGVTGASGMLYLRSFLAMLLPREDITIDGIISSAGVNVLRMEEGLNKHQLPKVERWFDENDFTAAPASGSSNYAAMVVLPCTMGSLAAIANGLSNNLIHRAADVMLKEKRTLVLAVRETPLNRTHLTNMLAAHDAGAVICPTLPSFYFRPQTLAEATDSYAWRLADQLGIEIVNRKRWKS
jgi:4-hydroxy-3-polyprenylbenzoate decarboxylase